MLDVRSFQKNTSSAESPPLHNLDRDHDLLLRIFSIKHLSMKGLACTDTVVAEFGCGIQQVAGMVSRTPS